MSDHQGQERTVWKSYPSWRQFSWLYFFCVWTAFRGVLFIRSGIHGWELWIVGAGLLLGTAALLRYWAHYVLTSRQVIIQNGYSGTIMNRIDIQNVKVIEVTQGPLARFLGIGTVLIRGMESDQTLRFRGITDPEVVETKIRALLPVSHS